MQAENEKLRLRIDSLLPTRGGTPNVEQAAHSLTTSNYGALCDPRYGPPSAVATRSARGWQVKLFGQGAVETVYASEESTARPFILFVDPRNPVQQKQLTVTGQSTQIGVRLDGPECGDFKTGALILFDFHGDRPVLNEASPYFIRGYGELFNDDWRFAFGQNADVVAPLAPIAINWTELAAAGNFGYGQRGQIRLERFLYPEEDVQVTFTAALSQQVVPDFIDISTISASDNGVPNIEGRISLGLGPDEQGE